MLLVRAGPVSPLLPDCSLQEPVVVQVARQVAQRLAICQVSYHHTVGVLVLLHRRLLNSRNTTCSLHHTISCLAPTGRPRVFCYWLITLTTCSLCNSPSCTLARWRIRLDHGTRVTAYVTSSVHRLSMDFLPSYIIAPSLGQNSIVSWQ